MSARLPAGCPETRSDLELAKSIVRLHQAPIPLPVQCLRVQGETQFYWRCPACGGWETYPPKRSEEFDLSL